MNNVKTISKICYSKAVDIKRLNFIVDAIESNIEGDKEVLDVGCGNGLISTHLGQLGYEVMGIDISEKAINKAISKNVLPNVSFAVLDAETLKEKNKKYSVIICSEVLEHLQEPDKMLESLSDILSETGILIITVPNGKGPREVFITKPMQWLKDNSRYLWGIVEGIKKLLGYNGKTEQSDADDLTHIHFFTKKSLKNLSAGKGFSLLKFGQANFLADVFPFSFITNKSFKLQEFDCKMADILPHYFTCGFNTVWTKK